MTLEELNLKELNLLTEVNNTFGLIDEKIEQLSEKGIFKEYSKVFIEYSDLLNEQNEQNEQNEEIESLKRAVFLKWYESAEPSFLSGIDLLSESASQLVLEKLKDKIKNKQLDYEFQWMLSHYINVIDFVFSDFINNRNFSIIENKEIWENADFDTSQFNNRGQMGIYWISVIESNKERLRFEKRKNDRKNSAK